MSDWQPIETAPKDRAVLISWAGECDLRYEGEVLIGEWDSESERWSGGFKVFEGGEAPTHWMPLPKPPKPGGGTGAE